MKKIFKAIRDKDFDLVRTLIENKEELVNCVAKQPPKKDDGQSPLQVALKTGALDIAEYLIDWAWFIGENREPIRLTTKPEPYTLQKALHWLQRQVAPTIKMVQALDRENHTTILKDMIEQAELKDKHKHLLQLEKSTIEERIDTAVPQENDGIF